MTAPAAADQRAALQTVTAAALADLAAEWATLDLADAAAVKQTLLDLLPSLADEYGAAASQLAVDVYQSLRDAAGITSGYEPQIATLTPRIGQLSRWATDPLFGREPAAQPRGDALSPTALLDRGQEQRQAVALVRSTEALQLAVADQYRGTITDTSIDDPDARGWQRVVRPEASVGGPCPFCVLLASRGGVYTRKTVDFAAHGLCHCIAVPAWGGQELPVKPFTPTGNSTPEQRAKVYAYMRKHGLLTGKARGDV